MQLVDFIGLIPTIKKAYLDPKEEDPVAWSVEMVAGIINALGVVAWFSLSDKNWIYALYLLVINSVIAILLWRPSLKKLF